MYALKGSLVRSVFGTGSVYQDLDSDNGDEHTQDSRNRTSRMFNTVKHGDGGKYHKVFDEEDDVPDSLMVEAPANAVENFQYHYSNVPGESTHVNSFHSEQVDLEQGINEADQMKRSMAPRLGTLDPRERALWKWANVENLDNFLHEVSVFECCCEYILI